MKKDLKSIGKLSKFDYNIGKRDLIQYCCGFVGVAFAVTGFIIGKFCEETLLGLKLMLIFFNISILSLLIFFITYLFPKTIKEIFADCGGDMVLELECWNSEGSKKRGSAIMIKKGVLVTNAHVVLDDEGNLYEDIYCFFLASDCVGRAARRAVIIKYDEEKDIAFLGVIPSIYFGQGSYRAIKCGSVASLKTGDTIYAVGNSCGNGVTISIGMVSLPVVTQEFCGEENFFIQLTVPTVGGNSGGAILNKRGRLVGMVTFNRKNNPNFTFAIPIERIIEYMKN